MKIKSFAIILCSLVLAIFIYTSAYDITDTNMVNKISHHLESENFRILEMREVENGSDSNQLVHFSIDDFIGVALLHKGINDKYQIVDIHKTRQVVDNISFLINGRDYSVVYGKSPNRIKQLNFKSEAYSGSEVIDAEAFFILKSGRVFDGTVEIVYEYDYAHETTIAKLNATQGSTWKTITIPGVGLLVVLLACLGVSIINKKYNRLGDYNRVAMDGQRIRQDWIK